MSNPCRVSLRGVRLCAGLACTESNSTQCQPILNLRTFQFSTTQANTARSRIFPISPRKRTFMQNHFSLFIRGPDGFDSWNTVKKCQKISWHCPFKLFKNGILSQNLVSDWLKAYGIVRVEDSSCLINLDYKPGVWAYSLRTESPVFQAGYWDPNKCIQQNKLTILKQSNSYVPLTRKLLLCYQQCCSRTWIKAFSGQEIVLVIASKSARYS